MYHMSSNFYPAKELKPREEGKGQYIGIADVTIANAVRIHGIGVFMNADGQGMHIAFPGYGEGDQAGSYVIPKDKEAYAAILGVVEAAVGNSENHFGWTKGRMNPRLEVKGTAVDEPYADGRYSIEVEGLCTLRCVSTREAHYEKDGQDQTFIAVDMPNLPPYERDGKKIYPDVFEGLKSKFERDGKEEVKDFGLLMRNLVLAERKRVREQRPSLEEQVANAQQKAAGTDKGKETPAPAMAR